VRQAASVYLQQPMPAHLRARVRAVAASVPGEEPLGPPPDEGDPSSKCSSSSSSSSSGVNKEQPASTRGPGKAVGKAPSPIGGGEDVMSLSSKVRVVDVARSSASQQRRASHVCVHASAHASTVGGPLPGPGGRS